MKMKNFDTVLMEVLTGVPCLKTSWEYLKLCMCIPCNLAIPLIKKYIYMCTETFIRVIIAANSSQPKPGGNPNVYQ